MSGRKNGKRRWPRAVTVITIIVLIAIAPLYINPLIMPGADGEWSECFDGEWYNRLDESLVKEEYDTLNRYAHYYGKHGCEPPCMGCDYGGLRGRWKLLVQYLKEDKAQMHWDLERIFP